MRQAAAQPEIDNSKTTSEVMAAGLASPGGAVPDEIKSMMAWANEQDKLLGIKKNV